MYSGAGYSDWEIGDVDIFIDDDGTYHLFHLIIPNHDYIAHATSKDGISWERAKNALFVGHPGEWDDDMLWTMHVSKCAEGYEMFYTGLQLKDRGKVQKIGRAFSKDLIHWDKDVSGKYPVGSEAPHYEHLDNNPREWLSFRDPFKYTYGDTDYLLVCGRKATGPTHRRGCVSLYEIKDTEVKALPQLFTPMVYDDVECPCLIELSGNYYLLGSIREDIKVRYWHAPSFNAEYSAFHDNVLLPQGNYAGRVIKDGDHTLVYGFYFLEGSVSTHRVLPPPKQLNADKEGRLYLTSFHRWDEMKGEAMRVSILPKLELLWGNQTSIVEKKEDGFLLTSRSGYEVFAIDKPCQNYIWTGTLVLEGLGKCGLVMDMDGEGNGYFISLDFVNGFVQFRRWGFNPDDVQNNFVYKTIQANQFDTNPERSIDFKLIRYGHYIELTIDGKIALTLVDYEYAGPKMGVYASSAVLSLKNLKLYPLPDSNEEYGNPGV